MIHCVARHLLVWVTAATSLLAGTPHVSCRCPDGSQKPVCFAFLTSATSACCGQNHDEQAGDEQDDMPSCCQHRNSQPKPSLPSEDEDGGALGQVECQKSLVQAEPARAVDSRGLAAHDGCLQAAAYPTLVGHAGDEGQVEVSSQLVEPAVADLVIALRHLLI
jgi:hypothetical protein